MRSAGYTAVRRGHELSRNHAFGAGTIQQVGRFRARRDSTRAASSEGGRRSPHGRTLVSRVTRRDVTTDADPHRRRRVDIAAAGPRGHAVSVPGGHAVHGSSHSVFGR